MKTSLNWLAHYVEVPDDANELAERLTMAGLEVEGIERFGQVPDGVVVGRVVTRAPHPNADRLSVCTVDVGEDAPLQIVCGAPNCDPGTRVPVATVGATLGQDFRIKKAKLRGVESHGMMCSTRELGLGDDHEGLMELPQKTPVGTPLAEVLEQDTVIDWEVTPNRPDWLSHLGIAREIAAVCDCRETLQMPPTDYETVPDASAADAASVELRAPDLCPRYIARIIRNVKIKPSPDWMQQCLRNVGIRPINNVVDITNFVMVECGQPLHAFDYDKLADHTIVVRRANPGESITTLDGKKHDLSPDNLLIADAERGVALAGVMGGGNSEISDTTTTVLLEAAKFNPASIRATARDLGIHTDSSHRFERGVGLDMVDFASRRATALLQQLAGGEVLDGAVDAYPEPYQPHRVTCRYARANALIGLNLEPTEMTDCLTRLGLTVDADTDSLTVTVPSFRLDLDREADLIEEIVRIHGMDEVAEAPAAAQLGGSARQDTFYPIQAAREELLALGLDETLNYTLTSAELSLRCTGVNEDQLLTLTNPISAESAVCRPSLIPDLVRTVATNVARNNHNLAFFEIGRVFDATGASAEERLQVGMALTGLRHPERYAEDLARERDFYDLKGIVEAWLAHRRIGDIRCQPAKHPALKPAAAAEIRVDGTRCGIIGQACDALVEDIRLKHPLFLAVIELGGIQSVSVPPKVYSPLPQFPASARDISLVGPRTMLSQAVLDAIVELDLPILADARLTDIFENPEVLGAERRGLTYSLTYRHPERTLTDEEVNQAHENVRTHLKKRLGVEFR